MPNQQPDLFVGERLKLEGTSTVLGHNVSWHDSVRSILLELTLRYDQFTSDDLRMACQMRGVPNPKHHNAWGASMSSAAKAGLVRRIGYQKSELPSTHARIISIWQPIHHQNNQQP